MELETNTYLLSKTTIRMLMETSLVFTFLLKYRFQTILHVEPGSVYEDSTDALKIELKLM
jgi:hypothetical protein